MADEAPKKRPGRPRKNPQVAAANINGIVERPGNPENIVELVHQNPGIFRKFFNTFKTYLSVEIKVSFTAVGLTMTAFDHLKKSVITCSVDGTKSTQYYCKEDITFGINNTHLKKLRTIGKNNTQISFIIRETTKDSIMYISLHNAQLSMDQLTEINMIEIEDIGALVPQTDEGYPLKFELPAASFKELMTNIQGIKNVSSFSIEKVQADPLRITYGLPGKIAEFMIFEDPEKIKLRSTLAPNEIFSITLEVAYVRHFASAALGDVIGISADRVKDIMLESELDGGVAYVRVFTQITKII